MCYTNETIVDDRRLRVSHARTKVPRMQPYSAFAYTVNTASSVQNLCTHRYRVQILFNNMFELLLSFLRHRRVPQAGRLRQQCGMQKHGWKLHVRLSPGIRGQPIRRGNYYAKNRY